MYEDNLALGTFSTAGRNKEERNRRKKKGRKVKTRMRRGGAKRKKGKKRRRRGGELGLEEREKDTEIDKALGPCQ